MSQADLSIAIALTGESQAVSALQQIQQGIVNASSGLRSASESASAFTSGLRSMAEAENALHVSLQNSITDLKAQRSALMEPGFREAQQEAARLRREIDAMTAPQQQSANGWMSMGNAVRGFMALQVVGYVKDATVAVFNATAEMQSLKMGLTAVMGSSSLAAQEMERLKEVAKLPGLGYAEAIRMSTSLQAAGFSAEQARKSMAAFGNALAIVGKGKADLDGVGLALTQIMSKGKVSAEEINQIAERVPQIREAMEAAFGTANTEMIQAMGLTSGQFIRGITDDLGKLEKVTGGLKNGTENLSDAWFQFKANVGGSGSLFQGALDTLASGIGKVNRLLEDGAKKRKQEQIDAAMEGIANIKRLQEKARTNAAYSAWAGKETQKEWASQLASYRAFLAKEHKEKQQAADAEKRLKEGLTDGQKDLQKQAAGYGKRSRAEDLKAEELANARRIKDAAGRNESLQDAEKIHQARLAEIKEAWDEKEKKGQKKEITDPTYALNKESERLIRESARDSSRETLKAAKDFASQEEQDFKDRQARKKRYDKWILDDEMRMAKFLADFEEEQYQAREKAAEEEAKKTEARNAMIVQAFDPLRNTIQGMTADMLNGELTMASFADSFKQMLVSMAAELAANAAIFALLSVVSGGAAGAFAGGLSGLSGLILGKRATGGSTLTGGSSIITGDGGRAERFTPTTPGQITNHVNNSTSSTQVVVYTQMSPTQYARAARRGELVQGRTRSARSH